MYLRRLLPLALVLVALIAGCGGGGGSGKSHKAAVQTQPSDFQGAVANPPKPAPALQLKDSTGKRFDISQFKGKAVLVTFLYTHCPDICPLIAGNLHTSLKLLGPKASSVQVVAVSTDPRGDTPKAVNKFLASHRVNGEMRFLIGSKPELSAVWKNWGIVAKPDKSNPDQVEHSAPIYGVAASGKITTLYPANFKPAQIVHDVPLLAKR